MPRKNCTEWVVDEPEEKYIKDLTQTLRKTTSLAQFTEKFASADLQKTQTNPELAKQFTDFLLGVETGNQLQATLEQIESPYWKQQYIEFQARQQKLSHLEALIYCPHNVMEMCFKPLKGKPKAGMLKGQFLCKVVDKSTGLVETIAPTMDWVQANIKKPMLELLIRQGKSYEGTDTKQGRLKGYVDVTKESLSVTIDKRQFSKIKYFHTRGDSSDDEKEPQWRGICALTNTRIDLSEREVAKVLDEKTMEQIKEMCNSKGYITIPPGESKPKSEMLGMVPPALTGPKVFQPFPSRFCQLPGERSCLILAVVNAFFLVGDPEMGNLVYNHRELMIGNINVWGQLSHRVNTYSKKWMVKKFFPSKHAFDDFPQVCPPVDGFYLLGIQSGDGKTDHAICVSNGQIIDANFPGPCELTAGNLDRCCSSDERASKFVKVWKFLCFLKR